MLCLDDICDHDALWYHVYEFMWGAFPARLPYESARIFSPCWAILLILPVLCFPFSFIRDGVSYIILSPDI